MENLSLPFLVIMILLAGSSRKKGDTSNSTVVDVFVRSLIYNGMLGYSEVHSVASIDGMTAVSVTAPNVPAFSLADHFGDGTSFFKDTSMVVGPYSHTPPVPGVYTYHVTFKNCEKKDYTNTLTSTILAPPVIDSLYKKPFGGDLSVRLKWEPVVGAQYYQIRISCGTNEIQPWGSNFTTTSELVYERLVGTFYNYLPGTITFELRALLYEGSDETHVQAISQT